MNREIKFRAWSKYNKEMYLPDGNYEFWIDNNSIGFYPRYDADEFTGFNTIPAEHEKEIIVMQYTGLQDKNGTPIYEGDIVMVDNSEPEENGEYDVLTICNWDRGCFVLEDLAGGHWTRQLFHQPQRLKIIGNIYEHPNLIKST